MVNNDCNTEGKRFARRCCARLQDVCVTLQGHQILLNVNLHIHCGQLAVIIRPNGAGKTTLLRAMLNELPFTGKINFLP